MRPEDEQIAPMLPALWEWKQAGAHLPIRDAASGKDEHVAEHVQVAVNNATFHFDKLYTYRVPQHLQPHVHAGSMVLVPFGRGTAARMGVVLELGAPEDMPADAPQMKELYDAAPEQASLSDELLRLVYFLKEHTFCTYYEAVKAIIPYGAQYKAVNGNGAPRLQKQLVRHTEPAYARTDAPWTGRRTEKQQAAWEALAEGPKTRAQLEQQGVTRAVLDALVKKGVLRIFAQDKGTAQVQEQPRPRRAVTLSDAQQAAYEQLAALMEAPGAAAALLHGVTSSGKTLVFLKLVEKAVASGRTALVLVPEISLTPQMIQRLREYFGSRVAVQHSGLSNTERLVQYHQIQNGDADVVVGTRSAVFAPLAKIGIIIIDEEQEHTYRSERAPRYSAHDVAKRRAAAHGALLLLASATPSTESYYAAQQGRLALVELTERYNHLPLPEVRLVDMREELAQGNAASVSRALAREIEANLAHGEQTILLLNRRGYQTVGMCTACGEVLKCGGCSVPMVYHKAENRLLCHYCGRAISPVPEVCPACGGRLKYTGFGTQRVEEELGQLFPRARVLRMDLDTTSRKDAHATLLRRFAKGDYDIMLGTQMVAKGLDFARVTLVGVLGIDQLLFAQGYKAYENVFSLVTQVVGRGGRAARAGRALIQTVDPRHPVLNLAARQDYKAFYAEEIAFRRMNLYPPFCTICLAGFSGEKEAEVLAAARAFALAVQRLAQQRGGIPLRLLGPAPMHVTMVNHQYRYRLTLKCRNDSAFRTLLGDALAEYQAGGWPARASVYVDFHSDADL